MHSDILYPTDGSGGAQAALETLLDLAEKYGATVHVLSVFEAPPLGFAESGREGDHTGMGGDPQGKGSGMGGSEERYQELRSDHQAQAESVVADAADYLIGIETVTAVETGDPHQVVLDYAEDNDIDMIVMGTHGRTGLDRYLIGSVTEKVVRLSDVPVLTVRQDE